MAKAPVTKPVAVRGNCHRRGGRDLRPRPVDHRGQLRDRVLGGDRVAQHRGVQRPSGPPASTAVAATTSLPDGVEDPLRTLRAAQPGPPVGEHRVVEPDVI